MSYETKHSKIGLAAGTKLKLVGKASGFQWRGVHGSYIAKDASGKTHQVRGSDLRRTK